MIRFRVDAAHRNFAASGCDDFVGLVGPRTALSIAPGLDRVDGYAEQPRGFVLALGFDVVGKVHGLHYVGIENLPSSTIRRDLVRVRFVGVRGVKSVQHQPPAGLTS